MMERFKNSKYIFVVGIGGSDLASKAVWNALTLYKKSDKKMFFLEAPDSREYESVQDFVNNTLTSMEEVVLVAVSKSGETRETLETYHKTFDMLSEKFGQSIKDRVIVISTPGSSLWALAESKDLEKIKWEGDIGGRFSAFTVAHTTALSIGGVDTKSFVEGGKGADESRVSLVAKNIFDNYKKGVNILDFFIFNSELEDLGKWARQLIAESLSTMTPTVSLGPTDLHSMLELYLGGPGDRFTIFIRSLKEIEGSVNDKAYNDTLGAYEKNSLPFEKYEMEEINEFNLGKFMAFMISVTLELATLLGVDPLDQPAVEEYKKQISNSK